VDDLHRSSTKDIRRPNQDGIPGAFRDHDGFCERALFVLDKGGIIRWSYVSPVGVNPGADGILRALDALGPDGRPA